MLLSILRGFKKIKLTSSRTRKEEILRHFLDGKHAKMTREILYHTYNPFWMYNVKSEVEYDDPPVGKYQHAISADKTWPTFKATLERLRDRHITGNKAHAVVDSYLKIVNNVSPVYSHWFMRILHKNLKIGLSASTVNKLIPNLIPTFKIQKATVFEDDDVLPTRFVIEPKYDGLRGVIVIDNSGHATAFSSKGKPLYNMDHILSELESIDKGGLVLDGELFTADWNESTSVLQTESKVKSKLKYYVFDMLRLEEWTKKKCKLSLEARISRANLVLPFASMKHVKRVPRVIAGTQKSLTKVYRRRLKEGYEGVMIKDIEGLYEFKRSRVWMKWKPVHTCDLRIVGVQEGEGEIKGMLGALLCMGKAEWKGKTYTIKTKVGTGTGFSRKGRKKLWAMAKAGTLLGKIAEVEFQDIAFNKTKIKIHRLRFPSYVRLRVDK